VALVLKSAKRESTSVGRCVAISSLAIYVYCQLAHGTKHAKVKESIAVLLAVLKVIAFSRPFLTFFHRCSALFTLELKKKGRVNVLHCLRFVCSFWLAFCYTY